MTDLFEGNPNLLMQIPDRFRRIIENQDIARLENDRHDLIRRLALKPNGKIAMLQARLQIVTHEILKLGANQ